MTGGRPPSGDTVHGVVAATGTADRRQDRQRARRKQITDAVMEEGSMRIEDLAARFGVSVMTAHRDIDDLANQGLLHKTRGSVTAAPTSRIESSDIYRASRQAAEKAAIARAALTFLNPGQAIFCDDSTTVLQMAAGFRDKTPLTVITNGLGMMRAVTTISDVTLISLGGQYQTWCNAYLGHVTVNAVRSLRADTMFFSMAAVTDGRVFHPSPGMVETKRAMFDAARQRILLADHTKFDRRALHGLATLGEIDTVIVDDAIAPSHLAALRGRGVEVIVAPVFPGA